MSDTLYNARQYVRFSADEFIGLMTTSFFAAFMLTFNDWGTTTFNVGTGLQMLGLMFVFMLFILFVSVWACKIVAIRVGYTIVYRAHILGLIIGLFIFIASAGFLPPLVIPGGFIFSQPTRLQIGKWHGYRKGWETGLIAGTFPLAMISWVMLFSPLYLVSQSQLYLQIIVGVCMIAMLACVPLPFYETNTSKTRDWFRHLHGATFGLDVVYSSTTWWVILCCTTGIFTLLAFLLTELSLRVGIVIYILSLILGALTVWIYKQFFK